MKRLTAIAALICSAGSHNRKLDTERARATYLITVSVSAQPPLTMICGKLAPIFNGSCAPPTRIECPLMHFATISLGPAFLARAL